MIILEKKIIQKHFFFTYNLLVLNLPHVNSLHPFAVVFCLRICPNPHSIFLGSSQWTSGGFGTRYKKFRKLKFNNYIYCARYLIIYIFLNNLSRTIDLDEWIEYYYDYESNIFQTKMKVVYGILNSYDIYWIISNQITEHLYS